MLFNPGDVVTVDFPGITGVKHGCSNLCASVTIGLIAAGFCCCISVIKVSISGKLLRISQPRAAK